MRRKHISIWKAGQPRARRSSSRDPFHALPETLPFAAKCLQITRHDLKAYRIVRDSLPRLCVAQVNMRDRPHPRSIVERSRMHRDGIGTRVFLVGESSTAIDAEPMRALGSAGIDLAPQFRRSARHHKALGFDQHPKGESTAGPALTPRTMTGVSEN